MIFVFPIIAFFLGWFGEHSRFSLPSPFPSLIYYSYVNPNISTFYLFYIFPNFTFYITITFVFIFGLSSGSIVLHISELVLDLTHYLWKCQVVSKSSICLRPTYLNRLGFSPIQFIKLIEISEFLCIPQYLTRI